MTRPLVAVVGDALVDRDIEGTTTRRCPDSAGPVVDVDRELVRPGGAALTAALLARDGVDVVLLAAVGRDTAGAELRAACHRLGVELVDVPTPTPTPQKVRIRVAGETVARVDLGCGHHEPPRVPADALAILGRADAVLASDYGRGVLGRPEVRVALRRTAHHAPVVWDPHPRGARPLGTAAAVTPNLAEATAAVGHDDGPRQLAARLVTAWGAPVVLTCGADGAVVAPTSGEAVHVRGRHVAVTDVCGAGDRFAGSLAVSLAAGASLVNAARAACLAAADYVAAGPAAVSVDGRTPVIVAAGGCFDVLHAGHVRMLRHARSLGDRLVVLLNSDRSVARLKGPRRPVNPEADRAEVLLGLGCVDEVVVFDGEDPTPELERLRPDVFVKGAEYAGRPLPEADVLARWGGRVELAPMMDGRSTTRILRVVAGGTAG